MNFKTFLEKLGDYHRHPCPITPQQNGRVERKNRHVVEVGLSLLAHSSVPLSYWPYAFQTAVYLINRLPTPVLNLLSPMMLSIRNSLPMTSLKFLDVLAFLFYDHTIITSYNIAQLSVFFWVLATLTRVIYAYISKLAEFTSLDM